MEKRGVYIIFSESGEYSDHRYSVVSCAASEADARKAVEEFARREAKENSEKIARPSRKSDHRFSEGRWVVTRTDDPEEISYTSSYDKTFGFQFVEAYTPPEGA